MPYSGLKTDEIKHDLIDEGMSYDDVGKIWDAFTANPAMFDLDSIEEVLEYMDYLKLIDENYEEMSNRLKTEIPSLEELLAEDYGEPRKFKVGCDYKGIKVIKESENEKVFIPSSDYCFVKCVNKFLELRNRKTRISTKFMNPYSLTIDKLKRIISGTVYPCKNKCPVRNEYDYPGKSCSKLCVKEKLDKYNSQFPDIYKVYYDRSKGKVIMETLNKAAPRSYYGIGLCHLGGNEYHAILMKGMNDKSKFLKEDITFTLVLNRELNCDFVRNKKPIMPTLNHKFCVSYDIETYTSKEEKNGKIINKLIPYALGYEIISLETFEVVSPYYEIIIDKKEDNLFNKFFDHLDKNPLVLDQTQIFAHNGGKFDNTYAKLATNVTFKKIIAKGSFIKQLIVETKSKKLLKFKDTLPFVLQPLKDACNTFKTTIEKIDFDIKGKSYEWYEEHKESKEKETDWRKYLEYDVKSLSQVMFGLEKAYNKFAASIMWFTGLPGIAFYMMNNYCFGMKNLYVPKDPSMVAFIREAYYGGRVIQWKRFYDAEQSNNGTPSEGMISIDMNSLYPSAMAIGTFPLGEPRLLDEKMLEHYDTFPHYIVEVEIEIPNIKYAYHPYRSNEGLLIYPSNQTITGVYNDIDIREMVKDGYKVIKVIRGICWVTSGRIFSSFIEQLYKERNRYKSLGSNHPEYPMEYVIKIVLNSAYGKFSETIKSKTVFRDKDYNQDITNTGKINLEEELNNGQKQIDVSLFRHTVAKPAYIAGYVTSYSRALVNEIIREIGVENVYYSDTDSLYVEKSILTKKKLECSSSLCGFKNDYGENMVITKAIFLDMKRYYLELEDRSVSPPKLFYKSKFNGLAFKSLTGVTNILTEEVVDINNLKNKEKMESVKNMYMTFLDQHNKRMTSPYLNADTKETRKLQREWEKEHIKDMKIFTEFWNRSGEIIYIETKELSFQVDPHRRGTWENNEFYSIGYDKNKKEFTKKKKGKINDLKEECMKSKLESYSSYVKKEEGKFSYILIQSYRPLMFNKDTDSEVLKNMNIIPHRPGNDIVTTMNYGIRMVDGYRIDDVLYIDRQEKACYIINAFGKMNKRVYKEKIEELGYEKILPLIAIKGTEENIQKYGSNFVSDEELIRLINKINIFSPFKQPVN